MSSRGSRRNRAQVLAEAADAYQRAVVTPHCSRCTKPCCRLDPLVAQTRLLERVGGDANRATRDLKAQFGALQSVLDSVQGPVARIMAVIVIIVTGLALAFGDNSGGFRKLIQIVFGLSIAFAASSFFLAFFSFSGGAVVS